MAAFLQVLPEDPAGTGLIRNARRAVLKALADARPAAALLDFLGKARQGREAAGTLKDVQSRRGVISEGRPSGGHD